MKQGESMAVVMCVSVGGCTNNVRSDTLANAPENMRRQQRNVFVPIREQTGLLCEIEMYIHFITVLSSCSRALNKSILTDKTPSQVCVCV